MAHTTPLGDEFAVLPVKMPRMPSCSVTAIHEIRVKRHTPRLPTANDSRSLFLKNVPVDSSELHFRALFISLIGAGRFETVVFEDENGQDTVADPAHAVRVAGYGKKRKREEVEAEERANAKEEVAARLPEIWTRKLRTSAAIAVVRLADQRSVELVLKAMAKVRKSKKYPVWGAGISAAEPPLGSQWITSYLTLARADKNVTQAAVHAFFKTFNRKEKEAAEMAKRLRSEPDEDGFVTVVRGGREAPANKDSAEEAQRKMAEKEAKKKSELADFYRFQVREKRKEEQAVLLRQFEEDRRKVDGMRAKRRKFRPET
jgi:ribosomal RNA-processing protein 7